MYAGTSSKNYNRGAPFISGDVCPPSAADITTLLKAWNDGDATALDRLTPLVYEELRRLAHRYMRHERAGHSLQTTALVNEAYLRLVDVKGVDWHDRGHFLALCAQIMRRILVDAARKRASGKRGGGCSTSIIPRRSTSTISGGGFGPRGGVVCAGRRAEKLVAPRSTARAGDRAALLRWPQC